MFKSHLDIVTYMTKQIAVRRERTWLKKQRVGETLQRLSQRRNFAISLLVTARTLVYSTCGMKKSRRVLEKWPRIATTANVIPEK
jgi:hypothetical protein